MPPYLDSSITPTNYKLHVEPDLAMGSENWFRGSETITLQALEPISRIVLNGKGLEIRNAQLGYDGKTTPIPASAIRYDPSPDNETITLELGQLVKKGLTVKLSFDFSGKLGSGKGLYKSMYTGRDGKPAIMASTQFEPADAREAFPCLDHPSAKATFDVSVTLDDRHEALSNTEPVHETRHGDGRKTVTFATTLKMSTYLLYIGVGEFEYLEDKAGNTAVRIVTMPGKKQQGRFAMSAAKKFLSYYETYFGIPYPLKKLDFIAVPDFTSGAMENWGAITFREDALLCDEKTASLREKQRIAITLSHELVHQWFGNLVTMEWWNGLWLNESFADMMAYKAVEEHYPELDPWAAFLARAAGGAFQLDDMSTTHPIDVDVRAPYEVDEVFDAISYTKGGMVLRMIERFIGSDAFRNGLHAYLTRHQYGNTTGEDLWAALSEASGKNVTEMARSWTCQPGFPLLTVSYSPDKDGQRLHYTQQRFFSLPPQKKSRQAWHIPLLVSRGGKSLPPYLIHQEKGVLPDVLSLPATSSNQTSSSQSSMQLLANSGKAAFLRVQYDNTALATLEEAVEEKSLDPIDRWSLHNDQFALCMAGMLPLTAYLRFVQVYKAEDSYLVMMDVMDSLATIDLLCSGEPFFSSIAYQNREIYDAFLKRVGMMPKKGEKETNKDIRGMALRRLGKLDDPTVLAHAAALFKDPASIPPDLRDTVYSLMAWQGDAGTYQRLKGLYEATDDAQEKRRILPALGGFRQEHILRDAFEYTLTEAVRQQNRVFTFSAMQANPVGRQLIWPLMEKHWDTIRESYMSFINQFQSLIRGFSLTADMDTAKAVKAALDKHPVPGTQRAIDQLMERTEINARFVKQGRKELGGSVRKSR